MSFIGRGECRHCGCGEYVKPPEGHNCYHCNHEMDSHLVKYKPQTTSGAQTRITESWAVQNTVDGATIDISQMHSEKFKQKAPDICFEETREVREPYAHGHFAKPQQKVSTISISPVTGKNVGAGLCKGNTPSITAQRTTGAVPQGEESRVSRSLPRTPIKASDVFVGTAPYDGPKPSCWRLRMSHLAYGTEPPEALCGSYKIAEKGQTIYVGNAESASIRRALRRHFRGKEGQNIGAYLSTLGEEYRDKYITVFWLGIDIKHACKCSYLKCFERMEGKKPQYNMQGHKFKSRPKRAGYMAVFTDTNKDKYGVARGRCKQCPEDCPQYSQPVLRHNCTYCGCPAGQHERVEPRLELIIKTEPGEEDAGSPGRSNGGPTPGPSRRPDGWTTVPVSPGPSTRSRSPLVPPTQWNPWHRETEKRCKALFKSKGVAYSQLERHLSKTDHGVFTILWKGEILYVGDPKKTPMLSNLRSIFTGGSNQDISKCLKGLPNNLVNEHVRVAWLKHMDDDPHRRTCREGNRMLSYRQCLSKLQARKPKDVLKYLIQSTVGR